MFLFSQLIFLSAILWLPLSFHDLVSAKLRGNFLSIYTVLIYEPQTLEKH